MKNGFGIKYQDFEKEGFRLDQSCNCAALHYIRRNCVTLQFSVLVKKKKERGRKGERKGGREGQREGNKSNLIKE